MTEFNNHEDILLYAGMQDISDRLKTHAIAHLENYMAANNIQYPFCYNYPAPSRGRDGLIHRWMWQMNNEWVNMLTRYQYGEWVFQNSEPKPLTGKEYYDACMGSWDNPIEYKITDKNPYEGSAMDKFHLDEIGQWNTNKPDLNQFKPCLIIGGRITGEVHVPFIRTEPGDFDFPMGEKLRTKIDHLLLDYVAALSEPEETEQKPWKFLIAGGKHMSKTSFIISSSTTYSPEMETDSFEGRINAAKKLIPIQATSKLRLADPADNKPFYAKLSDKGGKKRKKKW